MEETKKVEIWLKGYDGQIIITSATETFQSGSFYCVKHQVGREKISDIFPIGNIYKIKESSSSEVKYGK